MITTAPARVETPPATEPWIGAGYSEDRLAAAHAAFRRDYPAFERSQALDALRATDYRRLDEQGQIYLDYAGGGLYAESQGRAHLDLLAAAVFGNPHSSNPTSLASTRLAQQARSAVLEFFQAAPEEYTVIFTANASGALKLVGEAYPFAADSHYLLLFDNHNSVNGIREYARAKGARFTYVPMALPELRIDAPRLRRALRAEPAARHKLFAYPAQSNFSGVQHALDWIGEAQALGWDVLLDAAAFAPSNRLDLSRWHPDFVPLSFYKMFGYPTGVGCLIARRAALARLRRPWFAGGTITIASVQADSHYLAEGAAGFEDGTLNYLALPAVEIGLRHLAGVGLDTIHERVRCLTDWLLEQLAALRHASGRPLVRLYGPADTEMRGGTIAFNLYDPEGRVIPPLRVEQAANAVNISLRTGCFCNPGAGENALGLGHEDLRIYFEQAHGISYEQFAADLARRHGGPAGAVRISLGLVSTFADVYHLVQFVETFVDQPAPATPGPPEPR